MQSFRAVWTRRVRLWRTIGVCTGALLLLANRPDPLSRSVIAARSFVITDPAILAPFTFERVIASVAGPQPQSWLEMLAASQNETALRLQPVMPLARFIASLEGGYWRPAGTQGWSHLRPIAIVNRFDLGAPDYAYCGEYRVIFSRRTQGISRLHIALETLLPNPHPERGRAGCADVAAFWWDLRLIESKDLRREKLESFFFDSVFARKNFEAHGHIRTNEIGAGRPRFHQYALKRRCLTCAPRLMATPLDNTPDGRFFEATDADGSAFRREFLRHVASLSIPDVNRYSMNIDAAYSVPDIDALVPTFNYRLPFKRSLRSDSGREFRDRIVEELKKIGSVLTPGDIIDRAETQNCAGCHGKPGPVGGGLDFPHAFESGEHIADETLGNSANLSPALQDVFLPYRIDQLEGYLKAIHDRPLSEGGH